MRVGPKVQISKRVIIGRAALKNGNSAAYMLLHNHTEADNELIGVSSDVAAAAEMHLSQMNADGIMEMSQQESIPFVQMVRGNSSRQLTDHVDWPQTRSESRR